MDYLKCDGCNGAQWPALNTSWINFRQGFNACEAETGRDIVLSVETCTTGNEQGCQTWIAALANLWRTTGDIQATWGSVMANLDGNDGMAPLAGPGHWNGEPSVQVWVLAIRCVRSPN